MPDQILTPRLELRPLTPAFLDATLRDDREAMDAVLGASVPPDWPGDAPVELWRRRAAEAGALPWLARAIVRRATADDATAEGNPAPRDAGEMVGHAGFHLPPGDPVIGRWAPGGVEVGYRVFTAHQRQGYATETLRALIAFARERGVRHILAVTSAGNAPSIAVLRRCNFRYGGRIEDEEGLEDAWIWTAPPDAPFASNS